MKPITARLLACLFCSPWLPWTKEANAAALSSEDTPTADRVLFDFESGTYAGWTYEGAHAFEDKPFDTKEALEWREDRRRAGWQGQYMVTHSFAGIPGRLPAFNALGLTTWFSGHSTDAKRHDILATPRPKSQEEARPALRAHWPAVAAHLIPPGQC